MDSFSKKFLDESVEIIRKLDAQSIEATAEGLASVRAAGTTQVYRPTPAELRELKRALLPVHKQMERRIGKALIEEIYKATAFDPDGL